MPAPSALAARLRSALEGRVLAPGDEGFAAAARPVYGGFPAQPAVVAFPAHSRDVAAVVRLASESGTELAVRSGGHSPAGHSVTDGGILLHLGGLKGLEIDAAGRTAWAQGGVSAGEYTLAAAGHGLATAFGDTATVGVSGITLAGGIGYLARRHGLTVDHLLAAEVVTADGEIVTADEDEHPELFWALRGGGGGFGVVTRLKFRLHPLEVVTGGMLLLPASAEVVEGFAAEADAASDDLTAIAAVMHAPPMPGVPEEAVGALALMAFMCHAGPLDQAERVYAPFRALAAPLADAIEATPYPGMYPPGHEPGPEEEGPRILGATRYLDRVDSTLAQAVVGSLEGYAGPPRAFQIRVLGGAVSRVPEDATPYSHRSRRVMVGAAAFHDGGDVLPAARQWMDGVMGSLPPEASGAYPGFIAEHGHEAARQAYSPAAWERLRRAKAMYDPGDLFRRAHSIPPATRAT